jgi:hypothetical protein
LETPPVRFVTALPSVCPVELTVLPSWLVVLCTGLAPDGVEPPLGGCADEVPVEGSVDELVGCACATPVTDAVAAVPAAARDAAAVALAAVRDAAARAAACSRCEAGVRLLDGVPESESVAEVLGNATGGEPRKETIALATTNRIAAPATRDPAVPNPATYARVARISTSVIGMRFRDL